MQYKNKGPPKRSSIVRQTGIYLLMLRTFVANLFLPYQSFFSFVQSWFFLRSSTIFANHSTLAGS